MQPNRGDGGDRKEGLRAEPDSVLAIGGDTGPVAAAVNGIPTGFSDQLAGAGASSDIVAAARRIEAVVGNPALDTFPSGDLALLVAAAARLEGINGGTAFPQAQADIIRAYLRFLAGGGAGNDFLTAYSGFIVSYLDLIRAGGLPSGFASAGPEDVEAYLSFLASGGNRDAFAASLTDLTVAYFAFVRGGGDPAAFTGASQEALAQTIAFLRDSGLAVQLSAADRALVEAFLANGGLAFAAQYQTALGDYFAFLASGRLPSEYAALDQATLRAYLETLSNTGLLDAVLGDQAAFYAEYLAFLRAGGQIDAFAGLPANIFAGYTVQLDAYFAFLSSGRLPSEYSGTDIALLQAYLLELQAAGALERFLGERAAFFAAFAAFVAQGGSFDAFADLPANIFAGYAADLRAFFVFLEAGGVPSAYTLLTPEQIRAYIAALEAAGATGSFLGDLAAFYREYAVYLAGGGNPDLFGGLPVPPDFPAFAAALNAYAAFLQAGGLPSDYTAEDLARLRSFIDALNRSGQLAALQGGLAGIEGLDPFFVEYFIFIAGGGNPDLFAGLPGNGGGGNGGGNPGGVSTELNGVNAWVVGTDALRINTAADVAVDADGRITSVTLNAAAGNQTFNFDPNSGNLREFGRIGDAVAWSRYFVGEFGNRPNVSQHVLVGTPATNLPGTGTVNYQLVGGTAPTNRNFADEPTGWFTANLAVQFGAVPLVGLDFEVFSRTEGYRVSTRGGAANPGLDGMVVRADGTFEDQSLAITGLTDTTCLDFCQALVFGGAFGDGAEAIGFTYSVFDQRAGNAISATFFGSPTVTGLNAASCANGCSANLQGGLFGNGASHVGVAYRVLDGTFQARGIGVFAAPGAAGTPVTQIGTTAQASQPLADKAFPVADWSRWSGGVPPTGRLPAEDGNLSGIGMVPPGAAGIESIADPADRRAAIRQAEQLMGGMITFGGPAPEPR